MSFKKCMGLSFIIGVFAVLENTNYVHAELLEIEKNGAKITFTTSSPKHVGVANSEIKGQVDIQPDGSLKGQIRVPIEKFDSGNVQRDANVKELLEISKTEVPKQNPSKANLRSFSFAEIKLLFRPEQGEIIDWFSLKPGEKVSKQMNARLWLHGEEKDIKVNVIIERENPLEKKIHVTGDFSFLLTEFKIERPRVLIFWKLDDTIKMNFDLYFVPPKPKVA